MPKKTAQTAATLAYKVFNPDWTCRGFQFAVGETYVHQGKVEPCVSGFHACLKPADCFSYYRFDSENKVALVELSGVIETHADDSKLAAEKIKIVRQLHWHEVLELVNTGKNNTGLNNSGNRNSGNRNSGDYNSGNRNSGDYNSGNRNSGDRNSGDRNSGDYNSGDRNSGDRNSGDYNSGDCNSGYCNSGNRNSGDCNSGDRNSGDRNSGYCNKTRRSAGAFCTEEPLPIFFDKPSDRLWDDIDHPSFYHYDLQVWVSFSEMTEREKEAFPRAETHGGYLKTLAYEEMWRRGWAQDSDGNKLKFFNLPNFDLRKFQLITGLDVKADYARLINQTKGEQ